MQRHKYFPAPLLLSFAIGVSVEIIGKWKTLAGYKLRILVHSSSLSFMQRYKIFIPFASFSRDIFQTVTFSLSLNMM